MGHWGFTLVFIFSLLVISRNILLFIRKLFATEPTTYELKRDELVLLGVALSYILTYWIY